MGVVWQAHDELLYRTVAVKQLLLQPGQSEAEADEAKRRAMREGRIAARLQHPNAVSVFDVVDEGDGMPWLVMEYVPSKSLSAVLDERGSLPPQEAARIGMHVASALAAAHAAGIVHRDVKPGNVLLGEDGTVKITDFGISRAAGDGTVTATGMLAGTPAYLAPEIAKGHDPTPASDVFSLAATVYAAVEGVPPFGLSDNPLALLHKVASGQITPPQQAGLLTTPLMELLAAEPTERVDMNAVREAMGAVASGQHAPSFVAHQPAPATVAAQQRPHQPPPPRQQPPSRATSTAALPPVRPPQQRPVGEPEPSKLNRGAAIGVALAVVAAAVVGVLVVQMLNSKQQNNGGTGGGSQGGGTSATSGPSTTASTLPSRQPVTSDPTAEQSVQLVRDLYSQLPSGDLAAAWAMYTPDYQAKLGSESAWKSTLASSMQSISLSNVQSKGGDVYVVVADAHITKKDNSKVKQPMLFSIRWDGKQIFVNNETKVGAATPES
ncbi:hypothetical protein GCM10010174_39860 [Kutzneria viridogrisea]